MDRKDQKAINERIKELRKELKKCKTKEEKEKFKNELHNKIIESKEIDVKESDKIGSNLPQPFRFLYMLGRTGIDITKPKKK